MDRQSKDDSEVLVPNARIKGKKDPLKLKLEAISS